MAHCQIARSLRGSHFYFPFTKPLKNQKLIYDTFFTLFSNVNALTALFKRKTVTKLFIIGNIEPTISLLQYLWPTATDAGLLGDDILLFAIIHVVMLNLLQFLDTLLLRGTGVGVADGYGPHVGDRCFERLFAERRLRTPSTSRSNSESCGGRHL